MRWLVGIRKLLPLVLLPGLTLAQKPQTLAQKPQTLAQAPENPYRSSMDAMEASLTKQREAIRSQVGGAQTAPDEFFTFGWPGFPRIPSPQEPAGVGAPPEASAPPEPAGVNSLAGWQHCGPMPPVILQSYIEQVAEREGLTPDLLRAVINRESAFDPCAVSVKGAQGLMQLMPETAADLGVDDPFDVRQSIDGGARYLAQLLTRYGGDVSLALGAYNAGPTRVDQYHGLPPIRETLNYVGHIMKELDLTSQRPGTQPGGAILGWADEPSPDPVPDR